MDLFISSLSLHQIGLPHIRLYETFFVGISTEVFKLRQAIVYLSTRLRRWKLLRIHLVLVPVSPGASLFQKPTTLRVFSSGWDFDSHQNCVFSTKTSGWICSCSIFCWIPSCFGLFLKPLWTLNPHAIGDAGDKSHIFRRTFRSRGRGVQSQCTRCFTWMLP